MGTLARRIAQLEQQGGGQQGAGIWGIRRVHHERRTGADVVRVPSTGETLTEAGFRQRYPLGLLILVSSFGDDDPTGDEAA